MEKICIIADGYPCGESNHCVFVRELVAEFAKMGKECIVIAPQMVTNKSSLPYRFEDRIGEDASVTIYAPKYISYSSKPYLMELTMRSHRKAVVTTIRREKIDVDVFYGHFIYLNGLSAVYAARLFGKKSIIACGENSNRLMSKAKPYATGVSKHGWKKIIACANGIISVSNENKRLLIENGFVDPAMTISVFPNGVNTDIFHHFDKDECRRKLKIDRDAFVIAFVGAFVERKGYKRLDEAVKGLDGVKTIFIGKGVFVPQSDCVFCGSVQHDKIPEYLCAADIFVLPTLGEGCCNAIVEAVACGVPVVSSALPFNDGLLDSAYSVGIDPADISQIRETVVSLKNNYNKVSQMQKNAELAANKFSISERTQLIIDFIESV